MTMANEFIQASQMVRRPPLPEISRGTSKPLQKNIPSIGGSRICLIWHLVSALIRSQKLDRQAELEYDLFWQRTRICGAFLPACNGSRCPVEVESVMNHRVISIRKRASTVKHTLIGVSGGIVFDAQNVIRNKARVAGPDGKLSNEVDFIEADSDQEVWWWD